MSSTEMLCADNLGFEFQKGRPVLSGVELSVDRGELVGIIGPNGAGKTTLLKLLGRALEPGCGKVLLEGRSVEEYDRRELARKVAVVPQETVVAFPFTVLEIVLMGRAPYLGRFEFEKEGDIEKARQAMRLTDTLEFAGRGLAELSGGERQRVILAKALAQEPELLLLDEPTTFLDLRHQLQIYGLIRSLTTERGLAAIASSHDLNLAGMFCDRLFLLKEGRLVKQGKPEEVLVKDTLDYVYEVNVEVSRHPKTGRPVVMPEGKD